MRCTAIDTFMEEGEPDYGSDTWQTWKMIGMPEDHYHCAFGLMFCACKNPDETEYTRMPDEEIPI